MSERNESIYRELCGKFDADTLPRRAAYLLNIMKLFLEAASASDNAFIDTKILAHVVVDYFSDIARLKDFHKITNTNKVKITAYTAFWICRRKPIQLTKDSSDFSYAFINEAFATTYIVDELSGMTTTAKTPEYLKEQLFYHLKYRQFDAQTLELMINSYMLGKPATETY